MMIRTDKKIRLWFWMALLAVILSVACAFCASAAEGDIEELEIAESETAEGDIAEVRIVENGIDDSDSVEGDIPGSVIEGKDGWLFYDHEHSIDDYEGTDLFTDEQLRNIRDRLMTAKNYFDERGIQFVIFPAPNKEHVYSEYMPDEYGPVASYTRIEQLCDYLGSEFTIISPLQDLMLAKELWPQYYYYYKTDTHWGEPGAYVGAYDLMNVLGDPLPDFGSLSVSTAMIDGKDLAMALSVEKSVTDIANLLSGYGPYKANVEEMDEESNYIHYHSDGAPERSMIIFGDSFGMVMAPYLGQKFEDIYLHRFIYTRSMIEEEQPSVVVYELVERSLDNMLYFEILDE